MLEQADYDDDDDDDEDDENYDDDDYDDYLQAVGWSRLQLALVSSTA